MNAALFISGAACATSLIILGVIIRSEIRNYRLRRLHEVRRRDGRSILHRI